jgi:ankyrin repeat protein
MSRRVTLFFIATTLFGADSRDLLLAIRDGDYVLVQKHLRTGTDVNTGDADGTTPLMHSRHRIYVKTMKLLMDSGAEVNAKNTVDSTATRLQPDFFVTSALTAGGQIGRYLHTDFYSTCFRSSGKTLETLPSR